MEQKMADSSEEEDLELPPEIWRLVCDCLRPPQLGRLARTSRDVRTAVRGSPAFRQLLRYDGVWEDVHGRSILGVAVTGDSIITASEDRTLKILDAADGSCRSALTGHTNRVRCVCIMPDGRIVSGSRDGTLIVWALDGSRLRTLEGHQDFVWCVAALADDRVASGSRDHSIRIWDVNTGHQLSAITNGAGAAVRCLAVLPGGNLIHNGAFGELNLWDMQGRLIRSLPGYNSYDAGDVTAIAVLFESVVVAGREEGLITLWDTTWGDFDEINNPSKLVHVRRGDLEDQSTVWALASLPNKRVVAADSDGLLEVWRCDPALGPRAFICLQTLRGHGRAAFCLATLPDGRIVSGSMDRTLRFWAPAGYQIDLAAKSRVEAQVFDYRYELEVNDGLDPDEADRRCGEFRAQLQKTAEPLPTDDNYYERADWVSGQREGPNDLVYVSFLFSIYYSDTLRARHKTRFGS